MLLRYGMAGENIEEIVGDIFKTKFDRHDIEIERAHQNGKRKQMRGEGAARPRHILVKLLRYKNKVDNEKKGEKPLKMNLIMLLKMLQKLNKEKVRALYPKGIELRFIAGMWRDRNGKRAPFYDKPNETLEGDTDIIGFEAQVKK